MFIMPPKTASWLRMPLRPLACKSNDLVLNSICGAHWASSSTQQKQRREGTFTLSFGSEPTDASVIYMVTYAVQGRISVATKAVSLARASTFLDE